MPDPRTAVLLAAFALPSAAMAEEQESAPKPLLSVDFDAIATADGYAITSDDPIDGPYLRLAEEGGSLAMALQAPVAGPLTVSVTTRADAWPSEGDGFSATSPPTLLALKPKQGNPAAILRVRLGRPELALRIDGKAKYASITGPDTLPESAWVRVDATYDGRQAELFVGGESVATKRIGLDAPLDAVAAEFGAAGERRLVGDLDTVRVFGEAVPPEADAAEEPGAPEPG